MIDAKVKKALELTESDPLVAQRVLLALLESALAMPWAPTPQTHDGPNGPHLWSRRDPKGTIIAQVWWHKDPPGTGKTLYACGNLFLDREWVSVRVPFEDGREYSTFADALVDTDQRLREAGWTLVPPVEWACGDVPS